MVDNREHQLISRYKATGKAEYIGELYKPYMELVYGVCLKYLKDKERAKDAVMDIFEKLLVELNRHEIPTVFRTWLYVVTKNFCLMSLRKDGSESAAFQKMASEIYGESEFVHPLDMEVVDHSDALKRCLERLKEKQREAIDLFYYQKMSYREIAETMHLAEKSVKSEIQNGKRNLKICMEQLEVSLPDRLTEAKHTEERKRRWMI